jgi:hypothetical protein
MRKAFGTSKMVQSGQTSACFDADYYPFGGQRIYTDSCTPVYQFEGKERDTETGTLLSISGLLAAVSI